MSTAPTIDNSPLCVAAQLWLVEYLLTRDSLLRGTSRVPVLGRRMTNIANDIDQAINELGGACVYVAPLLPLRFNLNLPGPYIDRGEIRVRCIENDTLNSTLPTVHELVEAVARDVTGLTIPNLPLTALLPPDERPVEQVPDDERLIYDVVFHTSGAYAPRIEEQ